MPVLSRFSSHAPVVRPPVLAESPRSCGALGCAGGWLVPWKNRRRPVFEEEWGCGSRCLSELVEAAVRRETRDGLHTDSEAPHRHRVPLGLVLLAQGWITHPQLQRALDAQRSSGRGRIGDWLAQGCGLEDECIARGLGVQWNCPVLSVEGFSPAAMALVMPKRFVSEFGLIPLRIAGSRLLYVAFEERMNAAAALGLERMSELKVESGVLPGSQFQTTRERILAADAVPLEMKAVPDRDALSAAIVRALEQQKPLASRLIRVHKYYWLRMWLESAAIGKGSQVPSSAEDVRDYLFVVG